jgi:hypothetical protein
VYRVICCAEAPRVLEALVRAINHIGEFCGAMMCGDVRVVLVVRVNGCCACARICAAVRYIRKARIPKAEMPCVKAR